jgi:DNA-binding response OmpR family regulator
MARILLVDDDESARGVIDALLRYEGHEVVMAANAAQGLFMLKERSPDVVLSDISMPGMSGIEFCRTLRKDPETRDAYVILATGFHSPEIKTQGIASGADDYIGKPIRADELNARIRMALRIRGLAREGAELRRRLQEADRARLELDQIRARVTGLRGDLTTSLGTLLDSVRKAVEASRKGDAKAAHGSLEKLCAEIEGLRDRVAPREGS